MTENGPRCQDLTISGHDLSHLEVREGCAALSKVEEGSDGLGFRKSSLEGSGFRALLLVNVTTINHETTLQLILNQLS